MHKTAITSIENYHQNIRGEKEEGEDQIILEAVKKLKSSTGRMIWMELNKRIENSSISRSLNNLKKKQLITSPFSDKCPVTNIKVQWYVSVENGQTKLY